MVCVRFEAVIPVPVAFVMGEKLILSVEDNHCRVPVYPLTLNDVLLLPVHTVVVVAADTVPPLASELTAMVTELLFTEGHTPLVTTVR